MTSASKQLIARREALAATSGLAVGACVAPNRDDSPVREILTSTHWGTYIAVTRGDELTAMRPFPDDPDPSPLAQSLLDGLRHRARIARPMVRKAWLDNGPQADTPGRGTGPFVALDWDKAVPLVAAELKRLKATHGNQSLYAGSYGWASSGRLHHAQSQMRRFLNLFGGHVRAVNTYSTAAAEVITPHVAGEFFDLCLYGSTTWNTIVASTELVVAFGGIALKNSQVSAGGITTHDALPAQLAMADAGVAVVNISPLREDCHPALKAEWLAARPGSDTAIMLGLAHTLASENRHDKKFLATHCTGYERFEPYLLGATDGVPKDAEWAARISGLEAAAIRALARRMAGGRTLLSASWSLQRADNGEQPYWMLITLAAMLGQIGLPGGGFGFGFGASGVTGNPGSPVAPMAVPQTRNAVRMAPIPVARIADMLLNPGGSVRYNGDTVTYPDVKMIYWTGGNPFHHHQDLARLRRAWRKPETVIVHDSWWTPIARHADIVLPATITLERNDLGAARMDPYLIAMKRAVSPYGQAMNDQDIFAALAGELNFRDAYMESRDEMGWVRWLYDETIKRAAQKNLSAPPFDEFWQRGWFKFEALPERTLFSGFRADPDAHKLTTPSGKIEIYSSTIAGWGDAEVAGHAVWREPTEWLGADAAKKFPLHLITNQPKHRLHSQYDMGRVSLAAKVRGREPVTINPQDAAARGIASGDVVRVFNARGACLAGAVVTAEIRPGVVRLSPGAWYDPLTPADENALCVHGNANVLTRDAGTSPIAQGPSAQSCLVEIEKWTGPVPPLRAFEPPQIV